MSRFIYTDDEDELRDRAWRFLMPAHERSWFEGVIANLVRTRILPVALRPSDRASYHRALVNGPIRSPASLYRRLSEDVVADLALIAPFAVVASRVIFADRARLRSLGYIRDLKKSDVRQAAARVAENRCLIAWVRQETGARAESYRYALEHLLIEAPQNEAIAAEQALANLEVHRQALNELVGLPLPDLLCPEADEGLYAEPYPGTSPAGIALEQSAIVTKD